MTHPPSTAAQLGRRTLRPFMIMAGLFATVVLILQLNANPAVAVPGGPAVPCPMDSARCNNPKPTDPTAGPDGEPLIRATRPDHPKTGPNGEPLGDLAIILGWAMGIADLICLASFIVAAGRIGLALHHGESVHGVKGAVLACLAALIIGGSIQVATAFF